MMIAVLLMMITAAAESEYAAGLTTYVGAAGGLLGCRVHL